MKKRLFLSLILAVALLAGSVQAVFQPSDFSGGSPSGIVEEGDGLLISDVFNKVIWRVQPDGKVQRSVGQLSPAGLNGEPVGKYEDGTLDSALFMEPWAIAPFMDGYAVSDSAAHVVRWFNDQGVYTAVGSGKAGSADGAGTKASFGRPTGLAQGERGILYVADTDNGSIRTVTREGKVSTYVTGLVEPTGLCWYDGALYVAETGCNRILRIENGRVQVIAGAGEHEQDGYYPGDYTDGPISLARFDHPQGVAVGSDGTIYVADTGNHAIRMISDGYVTTLYSEQKDLLSIVRPRGMLVQGNRLLVTDLFSQTVLELNLTPPAFSDVPSDAWCFKAVSAMVQCGIMERNTDGRFLPDVPVTRSEFAQMISRMYLHSNGKTVIDGDSVFSDVPEDASYAKAVSWAADQGVLTGYANGTFKPNNSITREQLAVMLWRYAGKPESTNTLEKFVDHEKVSNYAAKALCWVTEQGIMVGKADGGLHPQGLTTRAQVAQMMVRYMSLPVDALS